MDIENLNNIWKEDLFNLAVCVKSQMWFS